MQIDAGTTEDLNLTNLKLKTLMMITLLTVITLPKIIGRVFNSFFVSVAILKCYI